MQHGLTKTLQTGLSGAPAKVYRFESPALQASIERALAGVEGEKGTALLQLEANAQGYNAAIAARIDGHWSVAAAYARGDWGWAAGATVKWAW